MLDTIVIAEKEDLESWSLNIDLSSICWCGLAILPEFGHFQGGLGGRRGLQAASNCRTKPLPASNGQPQPTSQDWPEFLEGPSKSTEEVSTGQKSDLVD